MSEKNCLNCFHGKAFLGPGGVLDPSKRRCQERSPLPIIGMTPQGPQQVGVAFAVVDKSICCDSHLIKLETVGGG